MKRRILHLLVAAARTPLGTRVLHAILREDPTLAREPFVQQILRSVRFRTASELPESLDGFEDLAFLFSSNQFNFGLALMPFDEAAYLYRLTRRLGPATIAEIGRFKGGSTFLIAAAMDESSELWSYDLHVKLTQEVRGAELDEELRDALRRYGLDERVHLVVADSRSAEPPPQPCDLVYVDGDHSYEGVRGDYDHWRRFVRPGGNLLFQDAAAPREFSTRHEGVARLMEEIAIEDGRYFTRVGGAGSIVHFARTDAPVPWAARSRAARAGRSVS